MTTILLALLVFVSGPAPQREEKLAPRMSAPDSVKYFIKIAPHDSTTDERMPAYTPDEFVPVDVQPVPITQVDAVLPPSLNPRQFAGLRIWVRGLIRTDGTVGKVKLMEKKLEAMWGPLIIAAAQKWRFTPAMRNGKAIEVWAAMPIRVVPSK